MSDMQDEVSELITKHSLSVSPEIRLLDLSSEVGELSKAMLLSNAYGKKEGRKTQGLEEEIGDCLFSLLALSDSLGIDISCALRAAIQKYEGRLEQTGDAGSGGKDG